MAETGIKTWGFNLANDADVDLIGGLERDHLSQSFQNHLVSFFEGI